MWRLTKLLCPVSGYNLKFGNRHFCFAMFLVVIFLKLKVKISVSSKLSGSEILAKQDLAVHCNVSRSHVLETKGFTSQLLRGQSNLIFFFSIKSRSRKLTCDKSEASSNRA